mmetsp:Transcript_899/g.2562  ORF Transcript_899/g.2562 Transcript_899/m.2562 type:complete len:637 (-) Transcript_899:66-1976(-)
MPQGTESTEAPDEVPLVSKSDAAPPEASAKTPPPSSDEPGPRGASGAKDEDVLVVLARVGHAAAEPVGSCRGLALSALGICAVGSLILTSAYLVGLLDGFFRDAPPPKEADARPKRQASRSPPPAECLAFSEASCLSKPGCRWFFFTGGDCPHCQDWFGKDHANVTGCRSWHPQFYCQHAIFATAQHMSGANPKEPWFVDAVGHYGMTQGTGEPGNPHNKRLVCSVWCDFTEPNPCFGQPKVQESVRGVNYGGRFVPEYFLGLPQTSELLFKGVPKPDYVDVVSLCDLSTDDAGFRMAKFLDTNIQRDHFAKMAQLGFNIVRIPLGYWNLIQLPGSATPNPPPSLHDRLLNIQKIMPSRTYRKWIDRAFEYAGLEGLKVILDLHSAPGGQSGNENTGCDLGRDSEFFFPTNPGTPGWNTRLGIHAVGAMAKICASHNETCYGIEVLNEPYGGIERDTLARFYVDAIKEARGHLHETKPIILNEWPFWLFYWKNVKFNYSDFGRVLFSTHLYQFPEDPITDMQEARNQFSDHLEMVRDFFLDTGYEVMVSEYALNSHGSGKEDDDAFDYNSLANWFVHQFNQIAIGSIIWNFDSYYSAWGPVCADQVGQSVVEWKKIFRVGQCHGGECTRNNTLIRL